ncbi:uncharacterized protein F4812DRAFT_411739 [Daldinia caldariorum]|uniref:uncharacterized protein n=1 Tax=Daldinia caldariorum TaxID=326644 RepID=UPI002007FC5A|nr:uncharacterized protein F4812DRAFT_411739 [Daldinia caldariorum]KAI1473143.1 hypothetical protein F4812DRAFT_411739 [Daldinia caldariorum]
MHFGKVSAVVMAVATCATAGPLAYAACQSACAGATLWVPFFGIPAYAGCQSSCAHLLLAPTP